MTMNISTAIHRIPLAVGALAVIAAVAVSMWTDSSAPTTTVDAHEKFQVVTVIAKPAVSVPATVTETDKPHYLQTPRATPQIRAPRTVLASP